MDRMDWNNSPDDNISDVGRTKLKDLLIDYCEIEGLRIVRLLDTDMYFAVRKSDFSEIRHLNGYALSLLRRYQYSRERIHELIWNSVEEYERVITHEVLLGIVDECQKSIIEHIGKDLSCDSMRAAYLLGKIVEAGNSNFALNPEIMLLLSEMYTNGTEVEKDPVKAEYWREKAQGVFRAKKTPGKKTVNMLKVAGCIFLLLLINILCGKR